MLAAIGGLSNPKIATRLFLSETTKGYISRMFDKLGCDNRTQAGLLAKTAGVSGGQAGAGGTERVVGSGEVVRKSPPHVPTAPQGGTPGAGSLPAAT